ncbi:MAG: hypothetical protein QXI89_02465 [Candidatus Anstonellales archaeon]
MEIMLFLSSLVIAFIISFLSTGILIKWQQDKKMLVRDMHKPGNWLVPGIGGPAILVGFIFGTIFLISLFILNSKPFDYHYIFAALLCITVLSYMGIVDDLFQLPSYWKFFLPAIASIALVGVMIISKQTMMLIPFIGTYDFGMLYPLLLIPVGIIVASNFTNMLAGFNGIESGMGIIAFISLCIISFLLNKEGVAAISFPMLGSLLAFFLFNKYPSKIFPGDSGTYLIGGAIASAVIIGNIEGFGAIIMIPYAVDAVIKAINKFPKSFADYANGKLYAPKKKIRGLVDLFLMLIGGAKEKNITIFFMLVEALFSILAIIIYTHII